jgi:hypothetical protein
VSLRPIVDELPLADDDGQECVATSPDDGDTSGPDSEMGEYSDGTTKLPEEIHPPEVAGQTVPIEAHVTSPSPSLVDCLPTPPADNGELGDHNEGAEREEPVNN